MDYRMITVSANSDDNVVDLIRERLNEQGFKNYKVNLDFIGFAAPEGTEFFLNNQKDTIKVPPCGYFITPYNGERYMKIFNLRFPTGFSGDIYYIV